MEPMTFTAGAIASLIFSEALKSGGQAIGKGASEDFVKLVKAIHEKLKESSTEGLLTQLQKEPTETNKEFFQKFLEMKMTSDSGFAECLENLFQQLSNTQTITQEMLTSVEAEEDFEAKDLKQVSDSSASVNQTMMKGVKAKNIKVEKLGQETKE